MLLKGSCFSEEIHYHSRRKWCREIMKAKEKGYFIELHYVGVESVEIAKERVKYRVEQGGHGIPEEDIERRFAIYRAGDIVSLSRNVPQWFSKIDA